MYIVCLACHWLIRSFFCSWRYNIMLKFISAIFIQYCVNHQWFISDQFPFHVCKDSYFKCIIVDVMTSYLHLRQFQASYLDFDQSELWNVFKGMPGGRFSLGGWFGSSAKNTPIEFYKKQIKKSKSVIRRSYWIAVVFNGNRSHQWSYIKCTYCIYSPRKTYISVSSVI